MWQVAAIRWWESDRAPSGGNSLQPHRQLPQSGVRQCCLVLCAPVVCTRAPALAPPVCTRVLQSATDSTSSVHQLCIPGGASLLSLTQAASEPDRPPGSDIDKLWLTQADTVCHSLASLTEAPPGPDRHPRSPQVTWDLLYTYSAGAFIWLPMPSEDFCEGVSLWEVEVIGKAGSEF